MKRETLVKVPMFCGALLLWLQPSVSQGEVALPNPDLIGKRFEAVGNVLRILPVSTLPKSVNLEIEGGILSGVICEYPEESVTFSSIKAQLGVTLGRPQRVDGATTAAWRLEEKGCAVMLTWDRDAKVLQVILRSIRKSPDTNSTAERQGPKKEDR